MYCFIFILLKEVVFVVVVVVVAFYMFRRIQQQAGFIEFAQLNFEEASNLFRSGQLDSREVGKLHLCFAIAFCYFKLEFYLSRIFRGSEKIFFIKTDKCSMITRNSRSGRLIFMIM